MSQRALLILGAGTFAIEVLEAAELSGRTVCGFVVSDASLRPSALKEGRPVFTLDDLPSDVDDLEAVGGIVSTRRSALVEAVAARGFGFGTVCHPSAIVSPRAHVGAGVMIGARAIVSANSTIGPHTILNRGANVAHDVSLGAFTTVGPGAVIAGAVTIGPRVWIGVGAVVRDHVTIGEGALVAAGALVMKPVRPHTLVAGSPARVKREGVDGH